MAKSPVVDPVEKIPDLGTPVKPIPISDPKTAEKAEPMQTESD